ncbi:hypothetical protein [Aquibium microcysteis]|uniref:hypothetical protein n=1 Tax=Aquibium microcysteis TaxID=675281 RepID=UPI00165D03ED|nr:hypothetical protein [Aquibium microcysteis]
MPNPFDQFDAKSTGNPFDRFDPPSRTNPARPRHPEFDGSGIPGYDPATGMVDRPRGGGLVDKVGAFSINALDSLPIVGPSFLNVTQDIAALAAAPFSDRSLTEIRDSMSRASNQVRQDNPGAALAGGVTGAVMGTMPMIAAAPAAFGMGGAGLGARSLVSGLSGAALGGADAAARGGDVGRGAMMGGAGGLVAPAAGQAAGAAYRAASDWLARRGVSRLAGMTPKAVSDLVRAMDADGISPAAARQRLAEMGPDAMMADLGPNLQQTAAGLVAAPGPSRAIVQGAIRGRDAGANRRILSALDDTLGPAGIPSQIDDTIRSGQRALSPEYEAAFANARRVETQPIADTLDSLAVNLRGEAQSAVQGVRRMLNVTGTDQLDPNPYTLFQVRQAIDGMLDGATDGNVRRALSGARQQIDETLRQSVPGIKGVDAKFAELARQREALERGQTFLDSGRTAPRPQELASEFRQGALPRGEMVGPSAVPLRLREGARAEIDRIVGTNANDRVALQRIVKGDGDWNRQRLATLFGQDKADRIIKVLDNERAFAETGDFVTRNSATAARTEAVRALNGPRQQGFGVREGYMSGGTPGAVRSAGLRSIERIAQALTQGSREANNASLARGVTGRDEIANALLGMNPPRFANPSQIDAITRALLISQGTGRP